MVYRPILGTLGYVMSKDKSSVLLINRCKRKDDIHYGKYNGLGGKLESGEDIVSGFKREVKEEAGIEAIDIILKGTINWPGFGGVGEDWFGYIFRVDSYEGEPFSESEEGYLEWVSLDKFDEVNFWESDRYWLDMVFKDNGKVFHGVAPFEDGKMISWNYHSI